MPYPPIKDMKLTLDNTMVFDIGCNVDDWTPGLENIRCSLFLIGGHIYTQKITNLYVPVSAKQSLKQKGNFIFQ